MEAIQSLIPTSRHNGRLTGDLAGVRVHKFGHMGQLYLLAYETDEKAQVITIYAIGGRENFYRDLKAYLKS